MMEFLGFTKCSTTLDASSSPLRMINSGFNFILMGGRVLIALNTQLERVGLQAMIA